MEFSNSGEQFACYQSIRRDIALYDLKGQNAINPQNNTITVINNCPTIFFFYTVTGIESSTSNLNCINNINLYILFFFSFLDGMGGV